MTAYASYDNVRGALRRAPAWVRSVEPAEIDRQRQRGFPDLYGDDFCEECGQRNPTWHVDRAIWSVVFAEDRGPVLCPSCFAFAWERATGQEAICEMQLRPRAGHREDWQP